MIWKEYFAQTKSHLPSCQMPCHHIKNTKCVWKHKTIESHFDIYFQLFIEDFNSSSYAGLALDSIIKSEANPVKTSTDLPLSSYCCKHIKSCIKSHIYPEYAHALCLRQPEVQFQVKKGRCAAVMRLSATVPSLSLQGMRNVFHSTCAMATIVKKKKDSLVLHEGWAHSVCLYVFACMTFVNGAGASVSHVWQ